MTKKGLRVCVDCGHAFYAPLHGDLNQCPPCQVAGASRPLPDSNPKTAVGATKPPLHAIPPSALLHLGRAMTDGEAKYGLFNWREHHVSASVYYDAALRHLLAWWDGEDAALDSGVHHLGHVMACCAILLDAAATDKLNDDRGKPGNFAEMIENFRSRS